MSDPEQIRLERNTIFVLAGLILTAIVSIAFYNLDRHPAFPSPSEEFLAEIDDVGASVVFADEPLALAALEQRQSEITAAVYPVSSWPPEGPVVSFGSTPRKFAGAQLDQVAEESVWSLWLPPDFASTPFFGTAVVEVLQPDGTTRTCTRDAEGAHQCGEHNWTRIRIRDTTVDGDKVPCIWSHPLSGETLRIRFPDVASVTSDGERLYLETGLRDVAVGAGGNIDFEVHLGNRTTTHSHRDRVGWQSTRIHSVDEPDELIVDVSAEQTGRRHACFRFDLR